MPNAKDPEIPELTQEWFASAVQPNRAKLRRGARRAVFLSEEILERFRGDDEVEKALRALLEVTKHIRKAG